MVIDEYMAHYQEEGWVAANFYQHYPDMRLSQLAVEMNTESMFDLITRLADLYRENPDEKELRLQFEENDYERGNRVYQDTHYKRPYTPSEEHLQKTLFDNQNEE